MLLRYILKTLVLPPAINLIVILLALIVLGRWRGLRNLVILLSLISLGLLSTPRVAEMLAAELEYYSPVTIENLKVEDYQAIVILGGGRDADAFEYGGDTPNARTLQRLRYGAYLQRETGLPILVTGGIVSNATVSEAELMAELLEREFLATVNWRETESRTTWENAQLSRNLLERKALEQGALEQGRKQDDIRRILLVTHAWHMPRAVYSFQRAGFEVTAAPTGFESLRTRDYDAFDYVPQAPALSVSSYVLHEMLGLQWYRFSY